MSIIFSCIDFRLHPELEVLLKERYGNFDFCASAGAAKGFLNRDSRDFLLSQIVLSRKLHNAHAVVLTMHRDCGACGGSCAFADREAEADNYKKILDEAALLIKNKFSDAEINKVFIELEKNRDGWRCFLLPV